MMSHETMVQSTNKTDIDRMTIRKFCFCWASSTVNKRITLIMNCFVKTETVIS